MKDLTWVFSNTRLMVSIHGDQSPEKGLVAGTYPSNSLTKRFEEQVAGTWPKNSNWFEFVRLVAWTNLRHQILKQKWPVHTMGLALKARQLQFDVDQLSATMSCSFLVYTYKQKIHKFSFQLVSFFIKIPIQNIFALTIHFLNLHVYCYYF